MFSMKAVGSDWAGDGESGQNTVKHLFFHDCLAVFEAHDEWMWLVDSSSSLSICTMVSAR